jgi:hypothetical protein
MGYRSSAPKNILQQKLHETSRDSTMPSDDAERIMYGVISEVNYNSGQVKVKKILTDGKIGDEISSGFVPLVTPLSVIHQQFGALREGLVVRVYYRGSLSPKNIMVDVIGEEGYKFLSKEPIKNEVDIGPYRIFGGSMF